MKNPFKSFWNAILVFLGIREKEEPIQPPVVAPEPMPTPPVNVEPEPVIIPTEPPIVVDPVTEQLTDTDVGQSPVVETPEPAPIPEPEPVEVVQPDKPVEVIPEPPKEEPVKPAPVTEVKPAPVPVDPPKTSEPTKPEPVIIPVTPKPTPLPPAAKLSLLQSPIKWGVAVKESDLDNPKMMDEVKRQFMSVSGENGFKIGHIMKVEGKPNFTNARNLIKFGEQHNLRVHAHCCFVWPTQQNKLAKFLHEAAKDKDKYIALMKSVVQAFAKEFKGKVGGVDIVNESHDDAGNLRPSYALTHMGPNYIEQLCKWYLEVDKDANLFISDFGFETDSKKAGVVIKYAGELKKKGLIKGISSQMHVTKKFDYNKYKKRLDEMAKLNLLVHLSEIDVMYCRDEDEARKAEIFKDIARGFRSLPLPLQYGCTTWSHTNEGNFYNYQQNPKVFTPVIFDKNFNGGLTLPAILSVK